MGLIGPHNMGMSWGIAYLLRQEDSCMIRVWLVPDHKRVVLIVTGLSQNNIFVWNTLNPPYIYYKGMGWTTKFW